MNGAVACALIVPYGETNFFTPAPGVRALLQLESVLMYAKKASGKHAGQSAVFVRKASEEKLPITILINIQLVKFQFIRIDYDDGDDYYQPMNDGSLVLCSSLLVRLLTGRQKELLHTSRRRLAPP